MYLFVLREKERLGEGQREMERSQADSSLSRSLTRGSTPQLRHPPVLFYVNIQIIHTLVHLDNNRSNKQAHQKMISRSTCTSHPSPSYCHPAQNRGNIYISEYIYSDIMFIIYLHQFFWISSFFFNSSVWLWYLFQVQLGLLVSGCFQF